MPDQGGGKKPPDDPPKPDAMPPTIEQRLMALERNAHAHTETDETSKLTDEIHWVHVATLISQVSLGVIGIFALLIYYGQLEQMRTATEASTNAVRLAQDSFEISDGDFQRTMHQTIVQTVAQLNAAHAAEEAAKTAKDTLDNARTAFRLEQRPLLDASDIRGGYQLPDKNFLVLNPQGDGTFKVGVAVDIKNVGKSTATELYNTRTEIIMGPKDRAIDDVKHYVPKYLPNSAGSISPNSGFVPVADTPTITAKEFEDFKNEQFLIFFVGAVKYSDIFPGTIKPYETTYCYGLRATGMSFGNCALGKGFFGTSVK
jgi:hypothetical protein